MNRHANKPHRPQRKSHYWPGTFKAKGDPKEKARIGSGVQRSGKRNAKNTK